MANRVLTDTDGLSSFTMAPACVMAMVACTHGCLALTLLLASLANSRKRSRFPRK